MSNQLNIPLLSPFKFYPCKATPGIHFDGDWAYNQIKTFETKKYYNQKWIRSIVTKLQITSTLAPSDLKLYNCQGVLVKSFEWTMVASGGALGLNAWECTIDFTAGVATDGIYYLYMQATLLSVNFQAISEPIHIKNSHPNVLVFKYKNSVNNFGAIFSTGIEYYFICEAGIMDFQPERDRITYVDEIHNLTTLSATPFRTFKLYIGEATGVPGYVLDILNRIFSCDHVMISDPYSLEWLQYETTDGSKWEVVRQKAYPLFGASIDISEAINKSSLQFLDGYPLSPGVVVMFDIDSNFWGTTSDLEHITEEETT